MALVAFIDSSIYLSFFTVSNDDLEQLARIVSLIHDGKLSLIVPAHVRREFLRNRDAKLAVALSEFAKVPIKLPPIPRFMTDYKEIKELRKSIAAASKARDDAISKSRDEAVKLATRADVIIQQIFQASGIIADTDHIYNKAHRRMSLREPPGKDDSLGDRLNWEHILAEVSVGTDFHIITRDGDYLSALDSSEPHHSLAVEWEATKHAKLHVHAELRAFLSKYFSDFKFSADRRAQVAESPYSLMERFQANRDMISILQQKILATDMLREAKDLDELNEAIEKLDPLITSMSDVELKDVMDIGLQSDTVVRHGEEYAPQRFFAGLIPRIFPLLSKTEVAEIERAFDIEVETPEFDDDRDLLTPDYRTMDLERLEEIADEELGEEEAHGRPD